MERGKEKKKGGLKKALQKQLARVRRGSQGGMRNTKRLWHSTSRVEEEEGVVSCDKHWLQDKQDEA